MSVLAKIRGELLSNITIAEKRQRKALIVLFDAIDSDLDMGYTMSSTTEEALDEYNAALMALDAEDDDPPTEVLKVDSALTQVDVKERDTIEE